MVCGNGKNWDKRKAYLEEKCAGVIGPNAVAKAKPKAAAKKPACKDKPGSKAKPESKEKPESKASTKCVPVPQLPPSFLFDE